MIKLLLFIIAFTPALTRAEGADGSSPEHHHEHHAGMDLPASPPSGSSLYVLDSRWEDQGVKTLTLGELRGRPVVLAMFYASCTVACPIIAENVRRIERAAEAARLDPPPRYVLVTFDPEHDSPAVLRRYTESHGLDPARWSLLRGGAEDTRELAVLLGVRYKRNADDSFSHSNLITLLNGAGEVVHRHEGLRFEQADVKSFVEKLQATR